MARNSNIVLSTLSLALLAGAAPTLAQTWNGGAGNGNWNAGGVAGVGGNWTGAAAPVTGAGTAVTLAGGVQLNTNQNVTVAPAALGLNSLTIAAGAGAFTVAGAPISFMGVNPVLAQNSNAGPQKINSDVVLTANTKFAVAGAGQLWMQGPITGAGLLTIQGAGTVALTAANGYTGGTNLVQGKLILENNAALGAAAAQLEISGGLLRASNQAPAAGYTIPNPIKVSNAFTMGETGVDRPLKFTGTVNNTGGIWTINNPKAPVTFTRAMTTAVGLTRNGDGVLTYKVDNNFLGDTLLQSGTTFINGTIGAPNNLIAGDFTAQAGSKWGGNIRIFQPATAKIDVKKAARVAPGNSPGVMSFSGGQGVTMEGESTYEWEFDGQSAGIGSGFHDQLIVEPGTPLSLLQDPISLHGPILSAMVLGETAIPIPGMTYTILDNQNSSPINGYLSAITQDGSITDLAEHQMFTAPDGWNWEISYQGGDGNDIVLTSMVPAPGTLALIGLGGLLTLPRRRVR